MAGEPIIASSSRLTIDRLADCIAYEEFLHRYLLPNRPCILPAVLVKDWPARHDWCVPKVDSLENDVKKLEEAFAVLSLRYGSHNVPVAIEHSNQRNADEGEQPKREQMSLKDAITLMHTEKQKAGALVYVKDWHLVLQERQRKSTQQLPYSTPDVFADDWMNNCEEGEDDFRFCYAGMAGTSTKLHRDVYTSYSWSTNIVGRKRWRLFPPDVKQHMRRFPGVETSELASSVDEMNTKAANKQLGPVSQGKAGWPKWSLATEQCREIVQNPGETIFVPSDWHHEVTNLTDCISLNHNWCNSTNLVSMYRSMCEEVHAVEEALEDVREMMRAQAEASDTGDKMVPWQKEFVETVQKVTAADAGWAWHGFWKMVLRNLRHPPCASTLRPSDDFVFAKVRTCLEDFIKRDDYHYLDKETHEAVTACQDIVGKVG